jgi:hypothetical protein
MALLSAKACAQCLCDLLSRAQLRARLLMFAALLLIALADSSTWVVMADDTSETLEYRLKAAFLYKFAGYVEWPEAAFPRPDTPVTIGVLGADAVASELAPLVAGRTVNNRAIVVRRLKAGDPLIGVNVLLIGKSENARLPALLPQLQSHAVLTVTEVDGALSQGSVINFTLVDRRVRFEVSLGAAEKHNLKLSSRLLAVAQQVHSSTP